MGRAKKKLHQVTLARLNTFVIPEGMKVTGWSSIGEDFCVVDSHNRRVVLLNEEGVYLKDIVKFNNNPLDVCYVERSIVAVTIPNDHMVAFIDTNECKIVESVVYRPNCYYIKCYRRILFIGCPNLSRIIIADLNGREIGSLNIAGQRFAVDSNNIYIANENEDLVLCYDIYGNQKWIAPDIVRDPIGIAVSYEYVAVLSKHNAVHIFSHNGYENRIVLNAEHGLDDPCFFYGNLFTLIVVCNKPNTQAIVYDELLW